MLFLIYCQLINIITFVELKLKIGEKLVEVEYVNKKKVVKEMLSTVKKDEIEKLQNILGNYEVLTMHTKEATLEEIFIKVTGRGLV